MCTWSFFGVYTSWQLAEGQMGSIASVCVYNIYNYI